MKKLVLTGIAAMSLTLVGCLTEDGESQAKGSQNQAQTIVETREVVAFSPNESSYQTRKVEKSCSDGKVVLDTTLETQSFKLLNGKLLIRGEEDDACVMALEGSGTSALGTWNASNPVSFANWSTGESCQPTSENDFAEMSQVIKSLKLELSETQEKVSIGMDLTGFCYADQAIANHNPEDGPAPEKVDCNTIKVNNNGKILTTKMEFPKNDFRLPKLTLSSGSKTCVMQVPSQNEVTDAYCGDPKRNEEMACIFSLMFAQ